MSDKTKGLQFNQKSAEPFHVLLSRLPNTALIALGLLWLIYAIPLRSAIETAAVSDAMALESNLKQWADEHADVAAVEEIFDDHHSLKLGGESETRNFRQMIRDISQRGAVPVWPGIIALILGGFLLIQSRSPRNDISKQGETSNRSSLI